MEEALTALIKQRTQSTEEPDKQLKECPPKTGDEAFIESCAFRIKKLPPSVRSFPQLQVSRFFLNVENPQLQMPITPLPATQQQQQQQQESEVQIGHNNPAHRMPSVNHSQCMFSTGSSSGSEQGNMYTPLMPCAWPITLNIHSTLYRLHK